MAEKDLAKTLSAHDEFRDTLFDSLAQGQKWWPEYVMRAALQAIEAQGFVIVPVEPSEAMKLAGGMIPDAFKGTGAARGNADRVYRAMIAAAQKDT